jgi:hypothetical protein
MRVNDQLLYDIKRVYAESHMVASFDNPFSFSVVSIDVRKIRKSQLPCFVNMVYNPTTMDVVLQRK